MLFNYWNELVGWNIWKEIIFQEVSMQILKDMNIFGLLDKLPLIFMPTFDA